MVVDKNFKIVIAYDGTDFCGWERQAQGERTVQGVLEDTLTRLTTKKISIQGAGRTDSGVHALGQVATFKLDREMEGETLFRGLNALLPGDIRILAASRCPQDFHARYSTYCKTYFYQILESSFHDPFRNRFFHRMKKIPDRAEIRKAASLLVGERDFSAMQASGSDVRSTVRKLMSIKVRGGKDWVRIFFTADGFLYRMIRNLISLIMAMATGSITHAQGLEILEGGDRTKAPPTFPGKGLFMWRICY